MRIKTKLYVGAFSWIGLLSLLSLLLFIFSFKVNMERKKEILADKFKTAATSVIILSHQYKEIQSTRTMNLVDNQLKTIEGIIEQAEKKIELQMIKNAFESLNHSYAQLKTIYKERRTLTKNNSSQSEIERTFYLEDALITILLTEAHKILDIASRISKESKSNMIRLEKRGNLVLTVFSLLLVILVGTSTLLIAKGISTPLGHLTNSAENIRKGDLLTEIPDLGTDEFGKLSHTLDSMRRSRLDAENELMKYHARLEDMVKERTAQLEVAKERAESADRMKSAFLASMSHELRTPLNSIIGFTGIILNEIVGPLNYEQKKELSMVKASAYHLLSLINDVLDISKIEAGELTISKSTFEMDSVFEQVLKEMKPMAEKKGLALLKEIQAEVGEVTSDERRIKQVLINLVGNAIKFTDKGQVRVSCKISKNHLKVCVTDSGIGVKKEDMPKLFKPFQQIDTGTSRKYEGSGLGLSICCRILELLDGKIFVESTYGEGSTFTVHLPKQMEGKSL